MPKPPKAPVIEIPMKVWWESRAIWLNVIGFAVLIVGIVLDSAGQLGISDQALAWLGVALTIGNAWLRFSTSQPISAHRDDTAVVTIETEAPAFISNRMLHEENIDLATKLDDLDGYLRDLRALRADLDIPYREPEDPALISTRQVQPDGTPFRG